MAAFSLVNMLLLLSLAHDLCRGSSLCKYNDFERSRANCANLRLRDVPRHLNSNLVRLDLPKNEIRTLSEESFSRYPNLQTLQLQSNYIAEIHPLTFLRLKYLSSLYLDQNQFESLNFILPETIEKVSLRSCRVQRIGKEFLQGLKYLESFDISDNRLSSLPTDLFSKFSMKAIELSLDFSSNSLTTVTKETVKCVLPTDLFSKFSMKAIELSLDFSSNSLTTVTKETVKSLIHENPNYSQLKINLMNNPIHCNCLLKWVPDFRSDPYRGPTILDVQGICASPPELSKMPIARLRSSDLKCSPPVILNDGEQFHLSEHTKNAKIHCEATGDPMPYIFFHISGENGGTILFPEQSSERYEVDSNGNLIIKEVRVSDAGNILCIAGNVVQNTTANLMLEVSGALSRGERAGIISGVVIAVFVILLILVIICCVCCYCPCVESPKRRLCCRRFRSGSIEKISEDNKFSREMNISSANSQRDSNFIEHEEMVDLMSNNSAALENVSRISFARDDPFHSTLSNSAKSGFQKAASAKSLAMERPQPAVPLDNNANNDGASKSSQTSEHSHNNQNSHFMPIRRPNEPDDFDDYLEGEDDEPRFGVGPTTSSTFGSMQRRGKNPRLSHTKPSPFNQTLDCPNRLDGQMYPPRTDPTPGFCAAKLPGGSQLFEEPENFVPNSSPLTLSRRPRKPPTGK